MFEEDFQNLAVRRSQELRDLQHVQKNALDDDIVENHRALTRAKFRIQNRLREDQEALLDRDSEIQNEYHSLKRSCLAPPSIGAGQHSGEGGASINSGFGYTGTHLGQGKACSGSSE